MSPYNRANTDKIDVLMRARHMHFLQHASTAGMRVQHSTALGRRWTHTSALLQQPREDLGAGLVRGNMTQALTYQTCVKTSPIYAGNSL